MTSSFDERAATWDDEPDHVRRAATAAAAIRAAVPLTAATRLLEYGAGTGAVSEALASEVGPVTLADPSTGMRARMEQKRSEGRLPGSVRIWDLDLATAPPPEGERFDLVVTVMTLHHIRDLAPVLNGFATLLDHGGRLCVVDLEAEDGSFHRDHPDFDGHDGFEPDELSVLLRSHGFEDARFERIDELERDGRRYPIFLATASRPTHGATPG
ncbi:MAG: class I SAM-dependent methyltransferase [Nitriliruptor sp.]|uniref:class I SAM-dependent methyltransferase n=1 Tax=Nitriliruptor sp. TaxID=2448056 RepID=UPI00349FDB05